MLSDIKSDFEFISDEVEGVLLFGSVAKGELTTRSDIDIALVRPSTRSVLFRVFERVGGKYDTKIFEDLPLHIKIDIINNHQVIIGDEVELSYYFYRFRKEWKDMEHRVLSNQFKSVREMINQRRAWLKNERKIPQED
ncbi:MAG: Nucleotidyltransferase domain protein [Candidatus Methanolliviera sp. GoM_asphalt]|nr:MAG: Nucleotidyltransferase domain protein [Candidatus Methanolliviera sp. GoM_asphalt]